MRALDITSRIATTLLALVAAASIIFLVVAVTHFLATVESEIHTIHSDSIAQFQSTRSDILTRVDSLTSLADRRTNQIVAVSDSTVKHAIDAANLGLFATAWDRHLSEAAGGIAALPSTIKPAIDNLSTVLATANAVEERVGPQLFDALSGARIASEATATTMRDIQHSIPGIITNIDLIAANSVKATDASNRAANSTAQVMANLAAETKPLPAWMRFIPLGAQVGSAVVGAAAAAGAFNH